MMIPLILMGIAEIQRTQIQRTQIQRTQIQRLGACRNRAVKRSTLPGRRKQPRGERLASRWLGGARMNEPTVLANDGILKALTKKSRIVDPPAAACGVIPVGACPEEFDLSFFDRGMGSAVAPASRCRIRPVSQDIGHSRIYRNDWRSQADGRG
jgi:hypothetical protein